jgi:hypothetical protein
MGLKKSNELNEAGLVTGLKHLYSVRPCAHDDVCGSYQNQNESYVLVK